MKRKISAFAILMSAMALFLGLPGICRADGRCGLTLCLGDDQTARLYGETDFAPKGPWTLTLAGGLPWPITGEDQASLRLSFAHKSDNWLWRGHCGLYFAPDYWLGTAGLSGQYSHAGWYAIGGLDWERESAGPDGQLAAELTVQRRWGRYGRLTCRQGWADVTNDNGGNHYRRSEAELAATWSGAGWGYGLTFCGTARRYDDPIDDYRLRRLEFSWRTKIGRQWQLNGALGAALTEEAGTAAPGGECSVVFVKRNPYELKIQAAYSTAAGEGSLRAGFSVGRTDCFFWRAGLAGQLACATRQGEVWPFLVCGFRADVWKCSLGLTPEGEYAVNSRHGYWLAVEYDF